MQIDKHHISHFRLIGLIIFLFVCGAVWIILPACVTQQKKTDRKDIASEVKFYNSKSFDRKFSSTLGSDLPAVTVKFPASTTLNDIPERLDKWFYMVEDSGGSVNVVPISEQRINVALLRKSSQLLWDRTY